MSNIQEVMDSQRRIEENVLSKFAEFQKELQAMASQDSKPNLDKLTQEFNDFKKSVSSLFQVMKSQIVSLLTQVDNIDNQQRRNALLFSGIKESDNEDCVATVLDIIHTKLNLKEILAASFYVCHRLGTKSETKTRPIIVRFTDIHARNMVWRGKKLLKSTAVVVSEFLTRPRQAIFTAARKHFGISRCWTQDGNIFVKLPDNDRKRIESAHTLETLMAKFPITSDNSTASAKASASSSRAPASSQPAAGPVLPATRRNAGAKSKASKQ